MILQESVVVVWFDNQDHIIPLGDKTREEIRCEINAAFKSDIKLIRKATLTFFRAGEHFSCDENSVKHEDVARFKTYIENK